MLFVSNKYAKIWKIFKAEEKYVDLAVSTSEKGQDGEFRNSNWRARAIGHAFQQDNYRLLIMDFGESGTDIQPGDHAAEPKANPPKKSSYEKKPEPHGVNKRKDNTDDSLPF